MINVTPLLVSPEATNVILTIIAFLLSGMLAAMVTMVTLMIKFDKRFTVQVTSCNGEFNLVNAKLNNHEERIGHIERDQYAQTPQKSS